MTNPQFGFTELAAAQSQPEVTVNAADRAITKAMAGEITIEFPSDADYELQASDPAAADDEWAYGTITMKDTDTVLTEARQVVFPDVDSLYGGTCRHRFVFRNETAQPLTIIGEGTGATGVEVAAGESALVRYTGSDVEQVAAAGSGGGGTQSRVIQVAASQYGQPIEGGFGAAYFRAPYAFELTEVRASLSESNSSGDIEVDIRVDGTSILTSPIVIEEGEKTSKTALVQPEIDSENSEIEDDAEILIDIDAPSGADAEGLIVTLIGTESSS